MAEVTIKQIGPLTVAFKVMRGPYDLIPQGFGELYQWVERYGLQSAGMPQALYISNPQTTPVEAAEWEVWAPIAGGAGLTGPDEEGFGVKRLEEETMASAVYVGPWDGIGPFYQEVLSWLDGNGYSAIGPFREIYYNGSDVPPEENQTEIQIPVARV